MGESKDVELPTHLPGEDLGARDFTSLSILGELVAVLRRLELILGGFDAHMTGQVVPIHQGDDSSLWDVDGVAKFLHRSPRWVYGAIASPRMGLPFFRLPGRGGPRFDPAAVRKWLETQCNPRESRRRKGA